MRPPGHLWLPQQGTWRGQSDQVRRRHLHSAVVPVTVLLPSGPTPWDPGLPSAFRPWGWSPALPIPSTCHCPRRMPRGLWVLSRSHLSYPRQAHRVRMAPRIHRSLKRQPFQATGLLLPAATELRGGRGRAESNSIFSVLSCTDGIQLGKKKPKPSQILLKKKTLQERNIFPHP